MPMVSPILVGEKDFGFKGLYIGDDDRPQYPESIYVLFNPRFNKKYQYYEKFLASKKLYKGYYDVSKGFVMHIISVPPIYIDDYHKFLLGEYTKFSKSYKAKFIKGTKAYDVVHGICDFPKWVPELEIFKKDTIIKPIKKWKQEKLKLN